VHLDAAHLQSPNPDAVTAASLSPLLPRADERQVHVREVVEQFG
jgi:hypothetical protein